MSKNTVESQIRERVEAFVRELDLLLRQNTLETLQSVLGGVSAPRAGGRGKRGRRAGRPAAPVSGDLADKIVAHVQGNDGVTVSQIAAALGADSKALRKTMLALLAEGRLRTTGQRRGTRYHVGGGKAKAGRRRRKA